MPPTRHQAQDASVNVTIEFLKELQGRVGIDLNQLKDTLEEITDSFSAVALDIIDAAMADREAVLGESQLNGLEHDVALLQDKLVRFTTRYGKTVDVCLGDTITVEHLLQEPCLVHTRKSHTDKGYYKLNDVSYFAFCDVRQHAAGK